MKLSRVSPSGQIVYILQFLLFIRECQSWFEEDSKWVYWNEKVISKIHQKMRQKRYSETTVGYHPSAFLCGFGYDIGCAGPLPPYYYNHPVPPLLQKTTPAPPKTTTLTPTKATTKKPRKTTPKPKPHHPKEEMEYYEDYYDDEGEYYEDDC